jgi:hypothetical protein
MIMNQTYWEFLRSLSAVEVIGSILFVGVVAFLFCTWTRWVELNNFELFDRFGRLIARPVMRFVFLVPAFLGVCYWIAKLAKRVIFK